MNEIKEKEQNWRNEGKFFLASWKEEPLKEEEGDGSRKAKDKLHGWKDPNEKEMVLWLGSQN